MTNISLDDRTDRSRAMSGHRVGAVALMVPWLIVATACAPRGPGGEPAATASAPHRPDTGRDPAVGVGRRPGSNRIAPSPSRLPARAELVFRAQELPFRYERGETGAAWPVETTGGGVGLFDFDGDGRLDLFFAQGGPLVAGKRIRPRSDALLRNLGSGQFEDVSA